MVAYGWAMEHLKRGDNIVLSVMEHHANIVPWHFLRERLVIELKWVNIDKLSDYAVTTMSKKTLKKFNLIPI